MEALRDGIKAGRAVFYVRHAKSHLRMTSLNTFCERGDIMSKITRVNYTDPEETPPPGVSEGL